ncbi:hypothetical protein [Neorhodopirellula pilleata]|uniref:Uncharacterized protein n=1 Tax=Neorhodopirellula pilleata TaxID=2714738 RepID=A0A5C6AY01_9BACT|nr:hypothetical protein [Neorhodopirellula pilleata]TWU04059.1 hypothetical protein Pla100_09950 [Neorhodopirellula pilleata]
MRIAQRLTPTLLYWLLVCVAFGLGLAVPAILQWTGMQQSRTPPLVPATAIAFVIAGLAVCLSLPYLPIQQSELDAEPSRPIRFDLRTSLLMTMVAAIIIAALVKFTTVVSGVLFVSALIYTIRVAVRDSRFRLPIGVLFGCMYLPYAWLVGHMELGRLWIALLWMPSAMPTLLPAGFISHLLGQRMPEAFWLAILLTTTELLVGTWIIRLGPKCTITFLVFVLLTALFSSFAFRCAVLA